MRVVVVLAVLLLSSAAHATPLADRLAEARAHRAALRYHEALASFGAALALGQAGPAEVRAIHREVGELHAGLGNADDAEAAFRRWLVLEPGGSLPPGTSPKLVEPFERARRWLAEHGPLTVRFVIEPGAPRRLRLFVDRDDLALVAGLRVTMGARRFEARGTGATVELPEGRLALTATARDAYGNALVEQPIDVATVPGPDLGTPVRPAPPGRGFFARPLVWGTAALVLGAGGVGAGLAMRDAEDDLDAIKANDEHHTLADAEAVTRRGRRWAWTANAAFAGAGACAIVGVVLWARGEDAPAEAHGVSLAPAPAGAWGLGVAGAF